MTVAAALTQLRANIAANLEATGQSALTAAWIYPDAYASISLSSLPVAIVTRKIAVPQRWGWHAYGVGTHRWTAEIFLLLHKGILTSFNSESAQVELLHSGWAEGMAATLAADLTLSGTCEYIGDGEMPGALFDYTIEHVQWAQDVYWSIHFSIPVTQRVTLTTG